MVLEITICNYATYDYPHIEELWEKTGLGGAIRGDNKQIIEQSLEMGGCLLLAKLADGKLVGTSWMTFDGRRIHLHNFGVEPEFQRKGIGRQLAIASIDWAKRKGYQVKLEVHQTNTAAIELYKNLGFKYLGDYDVYIIRDYIDLGNVNK